jgi:hypothetical protein
MHRECDSTWMVRQTWREGNAGSETLSADQVAGNERTVGGGSALMIGRRERRAGLIRSDVELEKGTWPPHETYRLVTASDVGRRSPTGKGDWVKSRLMAPGIRRGLPHPTSSLLYCV